MYLPADRRSTLKIFEPTIKNAPYNKRPHQYKRSTLLLEFGSVPKADWINIQMTETTESHSGHVQSRTISTTLDPEHLRALKTLIEEKGI